MNTCRSQLVSTTSSQAKLNRHAASAGRLGRDDGKGCTRRPFSGTRGAHSAAENEGLPERSRDPRNLIARRIRRLGVHS